MATILQWNIRGFNANQEELHLLLKHNQIAVCLQETLLSPEKNASLPGYTCLKRHTNRGSALCIRSDFLFNEITLDTPLEAIAARISNKKTLTVCSLYLSPSKIVTKTYLENLFTELPVPFLVVGDFNGHSHRCLHDSAPRACHPFILPLVFFSRQGPFIYIRFTLKPLPT
jgi:exonuclease III